MAAEKMASVKDKIIFGSATTCALAGNKYMDIGSDIIVHEINNIDLRSDVLHIAPGAAAINEYFQPGGM